MASYPFDLGVFVSFEVEFNDLRLMRDSRSDVLDLATSRNDDPMLAHLPHVPLNGTDAGCKEQCKIFLDEKAALIVGLIRKS